MSRPEFDVLIQQLSRKLFSYAFRIIRNQEEAEDVVQEVFIKLWAMGPKLDEYKSIDALATTITKNYCIDLIRRHKHNSSEDLSIDNFQSLTSQSPHEELENREAGEILQMIIADLPEGYRDIIRLRDIDGNSFEEIAGITHQNINTLRVTLSRARKAIRDQYIKYYYERRGIKKADRKVL